MKINYFVIPLIAVATMVVGRFFTDAGMDWYSTLVLPDIVPAKWVFSVVWPFLYACTTASALIAWNTFKRNRQFFVVMGLFTVNAFLNAFWTYLFFYMGMMSSAGTEAFALAVVIALQIKFMWPQSRNAALLLVPYLLWVLFAVYMNYQIIQLNP